LDKLDVRLAREILQGEPLLSMWPSRETPRPAVALLARKLGISESTIRARIRKLSEFVSTSKGTLIINPPLLGESYGVLIFEVSELLQKEKVMNQLRLVDGMYIIADFSGNRAVAIFLYSNDASLKRKIELISEVSGCGSRRFFTRPKFPPCSMNLSATDLRIVKSRLKNMSRSHEEIARELGVSSRTVKRRLLKMIQAGALMAFPSVDPKRLKDCVYCDLLVEYENEDSKTTTETAILSLVDEFLIFYGPYEGITEFNMIVSSVHGAQKIAEQVKGLENVRTSRIDFINDRIELYDIMLERVERQLALIKRAEKARPMAPPPRAP
jgi:DNA-binding Lrp family transcriptional regulator